MHWWDIRLGRISGTASHKVLDRSTHLQDSRASSVALGLQEMGYTVIYAPRNYELVRAYRQFPHLVKVIILEGEDARKCFDDPKCIKTLDNPLGIPAWKTFSLFFWQNSDHPLGNTWTLSPENYPVITPWDSKDNFYLGYSVERTCMGVPYMPPHERPSQVYVLAKYSTYFYGDEYMWKNISLRHSLPINLVAGIYDHTNSGLADPDGIQNLGRLNKDQFNDVLRQSRALLGVGHPISSPSPYDALCLGVPFINPVHSWNPNEPDDRRQWFAQHNGLKFHDPPYVYHVKKGDEKGLWTAIESAVNTPIERYIPPAMTMDALKGRLQLLVETNWREKAEKLLNQRLLEGGQTSASTDFSHPIPVSINSAITLVSGAISAPDDLMVPIKSLRSPSVHDPWFLMATDTPAAMTLLSKFKPIDLTTHIGTEFSDDDVQLSHLLVTPDGDQLLKELAYLVSSRGVVFFKNQDITIEQQKELATRLGDLSGRPETSTLHRHPISEDTNELGADVSVISSMQGIAIAGVDRSKRASDGWHSDISFERVPASYSILKMHTLPAGTYAPQLFKLLNADMSWASAYQAYDKLSPAFKKFLEGLTAVHNADFFTDYARKFGIPIQDPRGSPENSGSDLTAVHPVIRTNPVTGFQGLFVNKSFTKRIVELTPDESDDVLNYLFRHISENHDLQVRYRWSKNDVAIWDNRSTFHTATNDYSAPRQGNRVVAIGESPFFKSDGKSRSKARNLV
ncbi:hypothetical protein ONZ45_g10738 [Pleurotus djamor]|nr:hypothetical protein ONZ45_g10738 [Pleurotus djamor]